jgi:hypothetical protein
MRTRGPHAEICERIEPIGYQLAAIEQRLGADPGVGDLDRQISRGGSYLDHARTSSHCIDNNNVSAIANDICLLLRFRR